ncbi:hypothetical protein PENTCL1PPCAC_8552, partial [Pristionchus entomophagus]
FQNKFKPLKLLGQGGFGCVFEVEQNVMGRVKWPRAVKRIPLSGSENEVDTALREVATLNSLDHPGIVKFYDAWHEEPPEGWQVYTYCILFNVIEFQIPYVDNCSFLYIEMEPSNILLADEDHLKICDLGIAADHVITNATPAHEIAKSRTFNQGTAMYMAPEQKWGSNYTNKVDIFALGLILAEMSVAMTQNEAAKV